MTSEGVPQGPHVPAPGDGVGGDHLVWWARNPPSMTTVLAQAGIESEQVYRSWSDGFGAVLSGEQVDAVRDIPGVGLVEQDTEGRPAPYARMTSDNRIDGSFFVDVTPGTDPTVVAARLGLTPSYVFDAMPAFSADMTEVQLDVARRDPEVTYVEDNSYVYLD